MEDKENIFTYHKPTEDTQVRYERIRKLGKEFAELLDEVCPDSREKSLANTKIEEAVMWANASVARNIK